jgi:hypothetical protein
MRVERQVIREEVDAVAHQAPHALAEPTRQAAVLAAPEQAVMDEERVGA